MFIKKGDRILIMNMRGEAMEFIVSSARKPLTHSQPTDYAALFVHPQTKTGQVIPKENIRMMTHGVEFPEE
jgi:hypothetical protein